MATRRFAGIETINPSAEAATTACATEENYATKIVATPA